MNEKLNILLITSISPYRSAGLAVDIILAMKDRGHQVDVLTKYKIDNLNSNIFSVFDEEISIHKSRKSFGSIIKRNGYLRKIHGLKYYYHKIRGSKGVYIVEEDEMSPGVLSEKYLDKLEEDKYDLVLVLFMQGMFTSKSLLDIYQKLNIPILLYAVDMCSMTGGCNYFFKCRRFENNCVDCRAYKKVSSRQIAANYAYKKFVYETTGLAFLGNSWMNKHASNSPCFETTLIYDVPIVLNENVFCVKNQQTSRDLMQIPTYKTFVMMAGAAYDSKRKGFDQLILSLNRFYEMLDQESRGKCVLLLVGKGNESLVKKIKFDVVQVGFLSTEQLSQSYSASNVYLSPSIDDAGPSMVNQALMCGTPVVAYMVGTALDVVIDGKTGCLVPLNNISVFANSIMKMFNMSEEERAQMKAYCRRNSLLLSSLESFSLKIESIYDSLKIKSYKDGR